MSVNPYQSPADEWGEPSVEETSWSADALAREAPLLSAEFEADPTTLEAAVATLLMRAPGLMVGRGTAIVLGVVSLCGLAGLLARLEGWTAILLCLAAILLLSGVVVAAWFLPRVAARVLLSNWRQSPGAVGAQRLWIYADHLRHENAAGCYERRLDCLLGVERIEAGLVIIAEPNRAIVCPRAGNYDAGSFEAFAEQVETLVPQRL